MYIQHSYTPPPNEFGAPAKFTAWRDGQDDLFWDIVDSKKRFSIHNSPVGSGKSLAYMAAAISQGKRVAILTESKGLQDQLENDFGSIGLFDMRGLQNYVCKALDEGGLLEDMWKKRWGRPKCDVGPCTAGLRCDLKDGGCDYFDGYRAACAAKLLSTNYAYWIAIHKYGQGLGKFDMLILDEAHAADSQLSAAMSVEFNKKDMQELGSKPPKITAPMQNWRMWGRVQLNKIQGKLNFYTQGAKIGQAAGSSGVVFVTDTDIPDATELKFWKKLEGKCQTLSDSTDDWIIEIAEESGNIRIAPAFIRKYAESYLFLGIPRIVMMSATVRPKIADLLDLPPDSYEFIEYPSTFPVERRPIFWIPTVALNHSSPEEDLRTLVVRIDQIIARYAPYKLKGIIHTVSFDRQRYILKHSRFRSIMHANTSGNTQDVVKSFRESPGPAVLISPSVGTGFDFPYQASRFQIIAKLPFRDMRSELLKAQVRDDPEIVDYLVSQDLLQIYGRSTRSPDDASQNWILDNHIEWFIKKTHLFPKYFLDAFQKVENINPDVELLLNAV